MMASKQTTSFSNLRDVNLDVIRFIAIFGVVAVHVSGHFNFIHSSFLDEILGLGRYGVQLFFVVSGFLMSTINPRETTWNSFMARRVIRIYPLWLLFSIFAIFVGESDSLLQFFITLLFLNTLIPSFVNHGWPGGWTISAELIHYVLFPWLNKVPKRQYVVLISSLVISSICGWLAFKIPGDSIMDQWLNTIAPWNTIPFFVSGMIISRTKFNMNKVAIILFISWSMSAITFHQILPIAVLGISSFFYVAYKSAVKCKRVLSSFARIGEKTYEIYLVHWVLLGILDFLEIQNIPDPYLQFMTIILLSTTIVIVSYLISFLLSEFYDSPIKSFLRRKIFQSQIK